MNDKHHATPQSLDGTIKPICDIMRRSEWAVARRPGELSTVLADAAFGRARRRFSPPEG